MNAPTVLELPLDDALLKVLSSESRREILRLLRERRMTGAELATRLDLGKPAVAEHLKKLQDAELIERFDDPERRWVYYSLSARGRGILEPQRVRFYLVMAVAAMALMVGVTLALGLVVLMQGGVSLADGVNPDGSDLARIGAGGSPDGPGVVALPETTTSGPVAPTVTSSSPPTRSGDTPDPAGAAGNRTGPDPVYTGENRTPAPVGVQATNGTRPGALAMVLDEADIALLRPDADAGEAPVLIYVYRPQDVDRANGTVRLHRLTLDDAALAGHNLTEALASAAVVQGVVLLAVPETMDLPERDNGTASVAFDPDALAVALPGNATAPGATAPGAAADDGAAPATTEPDGSTPEAPADSPDGPQIASTTSTGPALTYAAPDDTRNPGTQGTATDPPTQGGTPPGDDPPADTGSGGAADLGLSGAGRTVPRSPVDAPAGSAAMAGKAAPIPLVALLAAALMVSIYIPMRRR